jgi:hypothetical protein
MPVAKSHTALANALLLAEIELAQDAWLRGHDLVSGQPEHWAQKVVGLVLNGARNVIARYGFIGVVAQPGTGGSEPLCAIVKATKVGDGLCFPEPYGEQLVRSAIVLMTMNDSAFFVVDWSEQLPSCCGWRFAMDNLGTLSAEEARDIWGRYDMASAMGAETVEFCRGTGPVPGPGRPRCRPGPGP